MESTKFTPAANPPNLQALAEKFFFQLSLQNTQPLKWQLQPLFPLSFPPPQAVEYQFDTLKLPFQQLFYKCQISLQLIQLEILFAELQF